MSTGIPESSIDRRNTIDRRINNRRVINRRKTDESLKEEGFVLPIEWEQLIKYCLPIKHMDIEKISIQDGRPISIVAVKQKIKIRPDKPISPK